VPFDPNTVGRTIAQGAIDAQAAAQAAGQHSATDVWSHAAAGYGHQGATDLRHMPIGNFSSTPLSDIPGALRMQAGDLDGAVAEIGKAKGALATTGAVFGALTAAEQAISVLASAIPFPAFPAVRVLDFDVGLPHAHNHPPNLIPPAPPVPLPSTGPVIPIPYVSGASSVLINGMPAGRCGDMGMGIWCGGYFPMFEIFLGSSSVWVEGMRAARIGVDITKHCTFSAPKPNDPPMGPMIGTTVSASPDVIVGGVPMPSLAAMAIGAAMKLAFKGLGKAISALRAARVADELVPMFSKGETVAAKSRPQALEDVLNEIKAAGVEVRADQEAEEYLNYCARQHGIDPSKMHAVTLGEDLIMVRAEHAENPRILREELIHTEQAKGGLVSSASVVENEIAAREKMIASADKWGITPEEVDEMQREIEHMRTTGTY
jgi:uncharacterized Zn-binding protein involved in type VI secretion